MRGLFLRFWKRWQSIGKKIGDFQARLLLTLFYFLVLGPFALLLRIASDPLGIKPKSPRGWQVKPGRPGSAVERARNQF
jgi:hypothetical protein